MFFEGGETLSRKEVGKYLARVPGVVAFRKKRDDGTTGWEVVLRDERMETVYQNLQLFKFLLQSSIVQKTRCVRVIRGRSKPPCVRRRI
ncbi:MAG: hypothetical protein G01um101429_368 [Parcubacteria group bacterium Gr01-1014_29]|nr:MAG: hypothetical protein G01um101429_368 [Parcubacteria group bacterium Gr01-1014_29]